MSQSVSTQDKPLVLSEVSFAYPNTSTLLTHVNLEVGRRETVVLCGENGVGKSTLIRLMLGELNPTQGEVRLFGIPSTQFHRWTSVGYVPQSTTVSLEAFPATVSEVIYASVSAPTRKQRRARSDELLETLGLGDIAKNLLAELSGGQLQRTLLARALANHPQLLLLDEPTSGLDLEGAETFSRLVHDLAFFSDTATILVTHDLERLKDLAAHAHIVAHITQGSLVI